MISRTPGETLLGIAARQWRDYQARTPGTYFAEQHDSLTLDEAYAIQTAISFLRTGAGDSIRGYKVGCRGVGTIEQFGMQGPIRGYLYRSELRRSGDELDSRASQIWRSKLKWRFA